MNTHTQQLQPTVIVYSTPTCPYCVYAKDFLRARSVAFEDVDISRDRAWAIEMVQKSGQMGVPVVDIGGSVVVGFQPELFIHLLSL